MIISGDNISCIYGGEGEGEGGPLSITPSTLIRKLDPPKKELLTQTLKYRKIIVFDTFIRSSPFESLTENDATGGAKEKSLPRELFHEIKT